MAGAECGFNVVVVDVGNVLVVTGPIDLVRCSDSDEGSGSERGRVIGRGAGERRAKCRPVNYRFIWE